MRRVAGVRIGRCVGGGTAEDLEELEELAAPTTQAADADFFALASARFRTSAMRELLVLVRGCPARR
jgi:hypothetical protein